MRSRPVKRSGEARHPSLIEDDATPTANQPPRDPMSGHPVYDAVHRLQGRIRERSRIDELRHRRAERVALGVLPAVALPLALLLWATSIAGVDLRQMNDLGLPSVLGPGFIAALFVLCVSVAVSITRPRPRELVLLAHVLVLILILFGTVPIIDSVPQGTAVYRHLGVADYVAHHGSVDRTIDAYFNWPGFFVLVASLTGMIGAHSSMSVATWGPVFFNVLYLPPLIVLFRAGNRSTKSVWLCVWLFFCANWVEQDTFAPQAFGYLGYLCLLALVVRVFAARLPRDVRWSRPQRAALFVIAALAYVAIVMSHQLTPYALIFGIGVLVAVGATRLYALPLYMGVVAVAWFAYSAVPFFQQFLRQEGRNIGKVSENVNSGLGARLAGTPEHLFVVNTRVAVTLLLWGLVPVGVLLRRRAGLPNRAFLALAASAVVLIGLQSYGGEILLRVYLFSLPAVVLFVAAIPILNRLAPAQQAALVGSLSLALLSLFAFARYGNARIEYFSPEEVSAMQRVYAIAPPGSLLIAGSLNLPWRFEQYNGYQYENIDDLDFWKHSTKSDRSVQTVAGDVIALMRSAPPNRAYLIFARSMEPWIEFSDLRRAGELARLRSDLLRSGRLRVVYENRDATVYGLRP